MAGGYSRALLATLAFFVVLVVFVNPIRDMSTDEDWAYALMVKHLLETGEYRLNDWASANLPFQTYWGAAFGLLHGFSFGALRLSTVTLMFAALVAMFSLARDQGLDEPGAAIVALGIVPIRCSSGSRSTS
jgi:hypothetical protein